MKSIAFATALALAGSIAVPFAQQVPSPSRELAHKIYVMTGCLEPGSTSTSAFRLTGAIAVGQAPPAIEPATPGKNGVYELLPVSGVGEQGINRERLQAHVGRRVEVTIRPVETSPAPSPSSPATDPATKPEQPVPQLYTVVKISQAAESCK